ncbi:hypothetical protein OsJ_10709 [Oryza sativa Japonica Group]|nr:hypothetical protein OsJ_10709 [Oryza sativa Japonica Group]
MVQTKVTAASDLDNDGGALAWVQDTRCRALRRRLPNNPATAPSSPAAAAQRSWSRSSAAPSWRCRRRTEAGASGGARRCIGGGVEVLAACAIRAKGGGWEASDFLAGQIRLVEEGFWPAG